MCNKKSLHICLKSGVLKNTVLTIPPNIEKNATGGKYLLIICMNQSEYDDSILDVEMSMPDIIKNKGIWKLKMKENGKPQNI